MPPTPAASRCVRRCRRRQAAEPRPTRGAVSSPATPLRSLLGFALSGDFVFVQVAEGTRNGLHLEGAILRGRDRDVVKGDDTRKLPDVARRSTHVVVRPDNLHLNRKLRVELLHGLRGGGFEKFELKPSAQARLVDIYQKC